MTLDEIIDIDKFTAEITEEITDLNEAMRTQTARAAYYAILAAKARKQAQQVELRVKVIEAALTKSMREKLNKEALDTAEREGTKVEKVTVDMVKAAVMTHPTMIRELQLQIDADEIRAVCNAASDAFRTRREMLTGLGHLTREQMRSNLTVQTATQSVSSYKARRAARRGEAVDEAAE
jgi:hypothetical protein